MQPSHLPLIWLKIIEQSLVRKQLIVKEDTPLLQFLPFVRERWATPRCSRTLMSDRLFVPQIQQSQDRRTVFCQHTPNHRYSTQLYSHRFAPPDTKQTSEVGSRISPTFSFSVERNSCQA